jgi:SAM-dependent methyltransferase
MTPADRTGKPDRLDDARVNRRYWDGYSNDYQQAHGDQLRRPLVWGLFAIPERRVRALGDVRDKDVLELGCGAAHWSIFLAQQGARPVGLDNSERQLAHARRLMH